jgi:hypothetical protein
MAQSRISLQERQRIVDLCKEVGAQSRPFPKIVRSCSVNASLRACRNL